MVHSQLGQFELGQIRQSDVPQVAPVKEPFVSVIVPVYNDAQRLKLCLAALDQQTYRSDRYEVIVVDNGSDPGENIGAIASQFKQALVTQELSPGSYAARNKGLSLAKGEIFAFTDSDCIPAPDWLEKGICHLLEQPNCGLVAGRIDVFFQDPNRATATELYDSIALGFPQDKFIEQRKAGATANVFTWRHVVDQVGTFNARLKSHGDMEWGKRVHAAGYQQVYADDALVQHPARYSFDELQRRIVRLVGGVYDLYITQESSTWKRNRRFLRILLGEFGLQRLGSDLKVLRDSRLQGLDQKFKVLGVMLRVKYVTVYEKIRLKLKGGTQRG